MALGDDLREMAHDVDTLQEGHDACAAEVRNLEAEVARLEREVRDLEDEITDLERGKEE